VFEQEPPSDTGEDIGGGDKAVVSSQTEALLPTPSTWAAPEISPDTPRILSLSDERKEALIHTFLNRADALECNVLHGPTTLAQWSAGDLDDDLTCIICAVALYTEDDSEAGAAQASGWMHHVQRSILGRIHSIPLPRLQALVLLIGLELALGHVSTAWYLLSIAARAAFMLRLNHERPDLDPVARESRRRLMWQIYLVDRRLAGGLSDLCVCESDRMMEIRLPCEERIFERGMQSKAFWLRPAADGSELDSQMDIIAYVLRLYEIRHLILR
jgi:hypothetical protein